MAETARASDRGLGLSITFGVLTLVAAGAMTATSYLYAINGGSGMRTLSGIAFGVAMVTAGLAVASFHLFDE